MSGGGGQSVGSLGAARREADGRPAFGWPLGDMTLRWFVPGNLALFTRKDSRDEGSSRQAHRGRLYLG